VLRDQHTVHKNKNKFLANEIAYKFLFISYVSPSTLMMPERAIPYLDIRRYHGFVTPQGANLWVRKLSQRHTDFQLAYTHCYRPKRKD
jgi:hypothetical protein